MPEYLLLACRFGRARPRGGMGQVKIEFVRKGQVENVSLQSLFTLTGSLRSSSQFVCWKMLKHVETISVFFWQDSCTLEEKVWHAHYRKASRYIVYCVMAILMYLRPGPQKRPRCWGHVWCFPRFQTQKLLWLNCSSQIEHFESVLVTMFRSKVVAFGLWLL